MCFLFSLRVHNIKFLFLSLWAGIARIHTFMIELYDNLFYFIYLFFVELNEWFDIIGIG